MKQLSDKFTLDVFEKPSRGKQYKKNTKSTSKHQAEFRQRHKFNFLTCTVGNLDSNWKLK